MFEIFEKLGGQDAAIEALRAAGGGGRWPSIHAVKLWRVNKEIPGPAVKRLMQICDERGIAYSAADFRAPNKEAQVESLTFGSKSDEQAA